MTQDRTAAHPRRLLAPLAAGLIVAGLLVTTAAATASASSHPADSNAGTDHARVDAHRSDPFPRYPSLAPAVSFWTRVFSQYSENQSLVQSSEYPQKILQVLDFTSESKRLSKKAFARTRAKAEKRARLRMEQLIRAVEEKRAHPETMDEHERRIYAMFRDVEDTDPFTRMRGTVRTQRGLKERTDKALQVSQRYLPYMEGIFGKYSLPRKLTRLPLVESSFNLDAYSRAGAAGIWQFIPSSARVYMRLNNVVDDRRDPWTSTDAAARHLQDDYAMLGDWPLAITAYNHGRHGISRALEKVHGKTLIDLIQRYDSPRFGFAGKNYYAEFLAAVDVEHAWRQRQADTTAHHKPPFKFEVVETKHYVPYETLRRLCGADDDLFRRLNPAYRPEVIDGKLYVPPGHLIRVPAGSAREFEVAYARLGKNEVFDKQRVFYLLHRVRHGDTLGGLAHRYRVSMGSIRRANGMHSSFLRAGKVLRIPPHRESRPGPISVAVGESKPSQTRAQRLAQHASSFRHRVVRGDTLSTIAAHYGISQSRLRSANGLHSSAIRIGQALVIPGKSVARNAHHLIREGETLGAIARRYGVSVADLRSANGLRSSVIRSGRTLTIPGASAVSTTHHRVRSGQTLGVIAHRYGVSVSALRRANQLGHSNLIQVGQVLRIPRAGAPRRHHRVRSGQTLGAIARRYGVSIDALRRANRLGSSSLIRVGQTLSIPASR